MKNILIAATVLLAGTAALAQGQQANPAQPVAPAAPMAAPDRPTSRTEMVAKVREHFARLDANKDGAITSDEMKASGERHGKRFERRFGEGPAAMAHDGKGHDANAAFDRLDANKDGMISREEFAEAREKRIERRVVRREALKDRASDAAKDGERRGTMMRLHRGMGERMIVMADSDRDGKITLAEAEAMAVKHFDEMDRNRDGQLSPDERGPGKRMMIHRTEDKKSGS